jgi:hypothetical protein
MGKGRHSSSALVGAKWSESRPCCFTPTEISSVPLVEEVGLTLEPVWKLRCREKSLAFALNETSAARPQPSSAPNELSLSRSSSSRKIFRGSPQPHECCRIQHHYVIILVQLRAQETNTSAYLLGSFVRAVNVTVIPHQLQRFRC